MIRNRDKSDVAFALVIVLFGLYVAWSGVELSIGRLARIGPGFFPLVLGVAIAALGIGVLFEPRDAEEKGSPNLRALLFVSLALLAFAWLVERAGLFPATAALVLLVAAGSRDRPSLLGILGLIGGLCTVGYVLFVWVLGLPLRPITFALLAAGG